MSLGQLRIAYRDKSANTSNRHGIEADTRAVGGLSKKKVLASFVAAHTIRLGCRMRTRVSSLDVRHSAPEGEAKEIPRVRPSVLPPTRPIRVMSNECQSFGTMPIHATRGPPPATVLALQYRWILGARAPPGFDSPFNGVPRKEDAKQVWTFLRLTRQGDERNLC